MLVNIKECSIECPFFTFDDQGVWCSLNEDRPYGFTCESDFNGNCPLNNEDYVFHKEKE